MTISVKRDGTMGVEITSNDSRSFYRVTEDVGAMRSVWSDLGRIIGEIDNEQPRDHP